MSQQETAYERLSRLRATGDSLAGGRHRLDMILSNPQRLKSRVVRSLVYLSQYTEEIAEGCADISGVTERLVRNLISGAEKADMALVISSGVGRVVAAQFNLLGIAMQKAIGAGLYGVSSILTLAVAGLVKAGWAKQRSEPELLKAMEKRHTGASLGQVVSSRLLQGKEKLVAAILNKTESKSGLFAKYGSKVARYLSANHQSTKPHEIWKRKTHAGYIWKNLHQYGFVTRSLMNVSHILFQGINKLMVSFDKHLGTFIGTRLLRQHTGEILGCRLGMLFAVGGAAGLSVPLSPFLVGIWTVGAASCAAALLALLLAKANVHMFNDWRGNISPPASFRSLAR